MKFLPGQLYTFNLPDWKNNAFYKKNTYRLVSFYLNLSNTESEIERATDGKTQGFIGTAQASFELKEEPIIQRPLFIPPLYPFTLPGIVFSSVGEENDITFDITENDETKFKYYTIEIPCAEKQKVVAPFEPRYTNGQDYKPLTKEQVVLVDFELFTARVVEVHDWLTCAELPIKTEGNQTVFIPKKDDKEFTVLRHYEDQGHLIFYIQRKSDPQMQILRIEEDGLHLIVKKAEEEDPQCHIWMNNEHTITVTSQDVQAKQEQTIKLEPKKITTLCEEGGDKSTITQTPTSITVKCDEFILDTKKTTFKSENETECQGKTVDIKGSQGINIEDGASIKAKAKTVDIEGNTTNIKGSTINIG